jgi:bacteriocin-type transport-associated protein
MTDILLQELSRQDMHWLQTTGTLLKLRAGDFLNTLKNSTEQTYLILIGTLSLTAQQIEHSARTTFARTLIQRSSGDWMGMMGDRSGAITPDLQAHQETWLLAITQSELAQKLQNDPAFAAHLYRAQALQLSRRIAAITYQMGAQSALLPSPQRASVPIFAGLQDSDVDWFVTVGQVQTIAADTPLAHSGEPLDALHILLDGALKLSRVEDDRPPLLKALHLSESMSGSGQEVARLSRGDLIGELLFVDPTPLTVTVEAIRATQVLSIPRWRIAAKLLHDVDFASRFYRVLTILLLKQQKSILQQLGSQEVMDSADEENDCDDTFFDQVGLAEARFDWMLKRIQTESGNGRKLQW